MTRTMTLLYVLPLVTALVGTASGQTPATRDSIPATGTSAQDSGLLDLLAPIFEKRMCRGERWN
jgi:ABC-type tungstate transport system permease subunit